MDKKEKAFSLFDAYNRRDPRTIVREGASWPLEYFLALQLFDWVGKLAPDAGEALLLASRCQHIGRWEIPRNRYPDGRNGYFRWRKELAHHHAAVAGRLLSEAGYDTDTAISVQALQRKERLRTDADAQVMEDALCLVFLECQYEDFRQGMAEEKITGILAGTWKKMSERGREAALKLAYTPEGARLLAAAQQKS